MYYLDKIYSLVQDCKRIWYISICWYRRCGFVATEFLNSFVHEKIITEKEKNQFLSNNISTIASRILEDFNLKSKSEFSKNMAILDQIHMKFHQKL